MSSKNGKWNNGNGSMPAWARSLVHEFRLYIQESRLDRKQAAEDRKQAEEDRKQAAADRESFRRGQLAIVEGQKLQTASLKMIVQRLDRNTEVLVEMSRQLRALGRRGL